MGRKFVRRIRQPRIVAAMLVSAIAVLVAAETASAQTANFTCRASVLRLEVPPGSTLLEPVVSNSPNDPCVSDSDGLPTLSAGGLSAKLLQSSTTSTPSGATSQASVAEVVLARDGVPRIEIAVATSRADVGCSAAGTPVFSGSSQVVGLKIAGVPQVVLGTPNQTINLPLGLGSIVLNQEIVMADSITRRAVFVDTALLRLAVAESIADVNGNPCAPHPPPECSDGIDNDHDGQIDFDPRNDPPLHPFGDQQCTSPEDDDESA